LLNSERGIYAIDTETTGLRIWLDHRMFALIIAGPQGVYYFNFQPYPDCVSKDNVIPREWLKELEEFFHAQENTLAAHNAKFDLAALSKEGIQVRAKVHCTEALGRIQQNNLFNYKLESLARAIGLSKSDSVSDYIDKHGLFTSALDSKGKKVKEKHFDRVPLEVIWPYGEQDGIITRALAIHQLDKIEEDGWGAPEDRPKPMAVALNEMELTKVCFEMEKVGVKIDRAYCARALAHEKKIALETMADFTRLTGAPFVDSAKCLAPAFTALGEKYPTTEKGNPSFTDEVLEGFTTPVARLVQKYRSHSKNANTYYLNFLKYADGNSVIHANMRQGGTETGRFSYSEPNLQNLPKVASLKENFVIRRAFIPRAGYCFAMIDCDQVEYRMMLDYAGQQDVIDEIIHGGLDVHAATALMMGVERDQAKTLNFMLLYGGGVAKLCMALFKPTLDEQTLKLLVKRHLWKKPLLKKDREVTDAIDAETLKLNLAELHKALALQELYFKKLPNVKHFTRGVIDVAKHRGLIRNWAGRVCRIADPRFAYIAPNHLIQGGCADVIKIAMVRLAKFLQGKLSRMLIQIHDEILFEIHETELDILPELKRIIEGVYTFKRLPLTCSISHSWVSWADKEKGAPRGKETRDEIQREGLPVV